MRTTHPHAHRSRSPRPASVNRDAWYARPARDETSRETFFGSRLPLATVSPETALMYAVLEDAFLCLQKTGELSQLVRCRARQAEQWFLSDDSRWIFAFLPICDVLGIDPEYLRKKLKNCQPIAPDMTQAKRLHAPSGDQPSG